MSFLPYPAYKDSGTEWLGGVPDHWVKTSIKHVVAINMGQSPSSDDCNIDGVGVPFLQGNGEFGLKYPTPKQYCPVARKVADAGDLLFSVRAPVGALNEADQIYGIGRGLCAVKASMKISKEFLWHFLSSSQSFLDSISTGSTFEAVSAEQVENIAMALPREIGEQTQIARFLDHETARIDALIGEQQRLIELLKEKRQAVISHAVTKGLDPTVQMKDSGVEWLGEVPAHWTVCQVRHLMTGDTRNGLYKPEGDKDPEGVGFVQMGEAFKDRIFQGGVKDRVQASNTELKNWGLEEGDLLFARRSIVLEGSGRCTRIGSLNEPHLFESSMIRVRLDLNRASSEYLHFMFDSVGMRAQVLSTTKTVTISGIDSGQLKGLRLAVPSKSEQENIAAYLLSRIEAFVEAERVAMDTTSLLQERRSALISAAVTGKIDVRGWQPPASVPTPELAQEAV